MALFCMDPYVANKHLDPYVAQNNQNDPESISNVNVSEEGGCCVPNLPGVPTKLHEPQKWPPATNRMTSSRSFDTVAAFGRDGDGKRGAHLPRPRCKHSPDIWSAAC
ncbi:hypothetical protein AAFF_G00203930 [Aldrovandia affinis]|uniref:Uncharacterized protein n=1 Tax=Aldrovandia affinis TaxID=143900 RepID=A0AAD7WV60_9TELE|nr:hypothetical protein AAFF_G00203930 [Aldrovandia affinis]